MISWVKKRLCPRAVLKLIPRGCMENISARESTVLAMAILSCVTAEKPWRFN